MGGILALNLRFEGNNIGPFNDQYYIFNMQNEIQFSDGNLPCIDGLRLKSESKSWIKL